MNFFAALIEFALSFFVDLLSGTLLELLLGIFGVAPQ